jgi:hypothetical protein
MYALSIHSVELEFGAFVTVCNFGLLLGKYLVPHFHVTAGHLSMNLIGQKDTLLRLSVSILYQPPLSYNVVLHGITRSLFPKLTDIIEMALLHFHIEF